MRPRIIVVYDVTDETSFKNVNQWLIEIERYARENICRLIVGNKSDLAAQRTVSARFAEEFCARRGLLHVEASARNNTNVEQLFETIVRLVKDGLPTNLSGVGPQELSLQLEGLEANLGALNISHNQLLRVPRELLRFTRLTSLDLRHNQLTDLPWDLFRLPRLNWVELDGNPALPSELRHTDFAAAASAMAARCCRATVFTVLLMRRYRESVFNNLNRDAMLMVCRDVWSTRYDRCLWLPCCAVEETEAVEDCSETAVSLPSGDKICTLQ
jgi:hypothetical protein